jgi:excisionase family DNA binding protein
MMDSNMEMLADLVAEKLRPIVFEALASAARSALEESEPKPRPLWSVKQVAARLGCCGQSVRRMVKSGRLPAVTTLAHLRFQPADVERLVDGEATDV